MAASEACHMSTKCTVLFIQIFHISFTKHALFLIFFWTYGFCKLKYWITSSINNVFSSNFDSLLTTDFIFSVKISKLFPRVGTRFTYSRTTQQLFLILRANCVIFVTNHRTIILDPACLLTAQVLRIDRSIMINTTTGTDQIIPLVAIFVRIVRHGPG